MLLHKGLDSSETLVTRDVDLHGNRMSLEEYCWATPATKSIVDWLSILLAGTSFVAFILSIVLISWMSRESKILYLVIGMLRVFATAIDAALQE